MRVLNAKSFWIYSGIAAVAAFLTYLLASYIWLQPEDLHPNAAYRDYADAKSEYDAWQSANGKKAEWRLFEETLAGAKPPDAIEAGPRREVSQALLVLKKGAEADPKAWSEALTALFLSPEGKPRISTWIQCAYTQGRDREQILDRCWFDGSMGALNDPVRLHGILKNDPAAFTQVPSPPPQPTFSGPKLGPEPSWLWPVKWIVASCLFAFCFCLVGLIARASADNREDWGHPFRGWPNFILGWLVMLAALPGFVFTRGLYLLAIDVTPAVNRWVKPGIRKFVSLFVSKPSFADEYEEFAAQLNGMREAAAGHPEIVRQIEELGAQVQQAQDAKKLAKLKDGLTHIKSYMELTADLAA